MDHPELNRRDHRIRIIGLVLAGVLLLSWFGWQRHRAQQDEYQTSLGLARVLSATFQARDKLEVGRVDGALDVTTVDPGLFRFLRSAQKATLPYSVAYQLDLSQLDTGDYRWDAKLTLPTVTFRYFHFPYWLRLVFSFEQFFSKFYPVFSQVLWQLVDCHSINAGTSLVLPYSLQRRFDVAALHHPLHQSGYS